MILSQFSTEEILWAIIIFVVSGISSLKAVWIRLSVLVSTAEVESSNIRIFGFLSKALAIHNLCFCPPETFVPPSSIYVSYFLGNFWINSSACANLHTLSTSSLDAFSSPQRIFSVIVPENSMFFCKTQATSFLNASKS